MEKNKAGLEDKSARSKRVEEIFYVVLSVILYDMVGEGLRLGTLKELQGWV